ncbi:DUF2931 family protein [Neisseria canis]|uniref:Protein of uncharacterized function (DUF2931) n=4 Tax=Neisseria canis TaxID=493 RepID=A0A448D748_9NEIS|nr:DUF2931 family protein [Neisseria canis]VEF00459.1 Protein of uncharacterised function (DUF2931) [Neisseria canis]
MQYWKQKDWVRYQVYISKFYEAKHSFADTYFTDEKGELIIHFGGNSGGASLGFGSQSSPNDYFPVPSTLHILWFNPLDNQFWQGKFAMPKERLTELFKQCDYISIREKNSEARCPFDQFIINAVPTGQVFVYLGGWQVRFIGQYQAQKTDTDWERFARGIGGYPEMVSDVEPRRQYVDDAKKHFFEDKNEVHQESIAALKETPPPNDPAYWNRFFKTYRWRLAVNRPNVLTDYDANYVNGEFLLTPKEEVGRFRDAPVPEAIIFIIKQADGSKASYVMEFDKKAIMAAFEKMAAYGKPITFQADFDKKYDELDVYLTAEGVEEKIILDPTRLALQD